MASRPSCCSRSSSIVVSRVASSSAMTGVIRRRCLGSRLPSCGRLLVCVVCGSPSSRS